MTNLMAVFCLSVADTNKHRSFDCKHCDLKVAVNPIPGRSANSSMNSKLSNRLQSTVTQRIRNLATLEQNITN